MAVLGMLDIDKLSLILFNCETIGRQVMSDDIADNSKKNDLCKVQFKEKMGNASSLKVKSRMQKYKANKMQTIHLSHLLIQIKWSQVTITMI